MLVDVSVRDGPSSRLTKKHRFRRTWASSRGPWRHHNHGNPATRPGRHRRAREADYGLPRSPVSRTEGEKGATKTIQRKRNKGPKTHKKKKKKKKKKERKKGKTSKLHSREEQRRHRLQREQPTSSNTQTHRHSNTSHKGTKITIAHR